MKIVIQDIFLKQMQSIQKNYLVLIKTYHFYQKEKNQKKQKNLFVVQKTKKKICHSHESFKKALNHGLILKEVHRVIRFNQEAWLEPYTDINTKLRKEAKNEFQKNSLS